MRTRQQARNACAVPTQSKVLRYCQMPPLPSHGQKRALQAANRPSILRCRAVAAFIMIFFSSLICHTGLIRLYGDTCGLNWHSIHRLLTVRSPWCSGLNWACWATGEIVERGWYHSIGLGIYALVETLNSVVLAHRPQDQETKIKAGQAAQRYECAKSMPRLL